MKRAIFWNVLLTLSAVCFYSFGQDLVPTECATSIGGNKYGYKDKITGEIVIPCNYQKVWNFSEHIEGLAMVLKNTTPTDMRATLKYGFIDKSGKEVVSMKYDEIYKFSEHIEGWAMIKADGKYGFIDKTGKEVIPAKYLNSEYKFSEGLAVVKTGNHSFGFIDKSGKEVIPCKYESAEDFYRGLARVTLKNARFINEGGYVDIADTFYKGGRRDRADKIVAAKKEKGEYDAIIAQIEQAERDAKQR